MGSYPRGVDQLMRECVISQGDVVIQVWMEHDGDPSRAHLEATPAL